jgi:hypothetical protein
MNRCDECGTSKKVVRVEGGQRYLCWTCFGKQTHEIDHYGPEVQPDHPTQAPPGSEVKIREMIRRVELGMEVDHPKDLKLRKR